MKKNNPRLKVHFQVESYKPTDILLPIDLLEHGGIPCHSIILDNPNTQVSVCETEKVIIHSHDGLCVINITDFIVHYSYSWNVF